MSLSLRLKDLLGPVTRVKKKKKKRFEAPVPPREDGETAPVPPEMASG